MKKNILITLGLIASWLIIVQCLSLENASTFGKWTGNIINVYIYCVFLPRLIWKFMKKIFNKSSGAAHPVVMQSFQSPILFQSKVCGFVIKE